MTSGRSDPPLVSCLCVTEDRPEFMPWLLWNFDRQSWPRRELVVVDSSSPPAPLPERDDLRVVRAPPGSSVAAKRNLALDSARGELLTWFDDDDWQHPQKIALLARALGRDRPFAGCRESWFVDLESGGCSIYRVTGQRVLFNGALFRTASARAARFDERLRKASDTRWLRSLGRGSRPAAVVDRPLFFWLCHQRNLSNPAAGKRFDLSLERLIRSLGRDVWGDTGEALEALRQRVSERAAAAPVAPAAESLSGPRRRAVRVRRRGRPRRAAHPGRPAADPPAERFDVPVTAMIKATVQDAGYLATLVPHMLRQARYPFAERLVVVDPRREFAGKYRHRAAGSRGDLDRALGELLDRGVIDRVEEVPYDRARIDSINELYFGRAGVPTHATTGGPIYPTLWGLEQARAEHVLQFDADILFYTDGESWVARALSCMERDPSLWAMMTHAGPPAGPPGRSLAGANLRRARWDAALEVWRFRSVSTRFFLADRRRLRGRLRGGWGRGGCPPLEQCISRSLVAHGAYRGDVGTCRSWHLHAFSHAPPFPEWAPRLVEVVEAGRYPASQAGSYDLRLERAAERGAWQRLLFGPSVPPVAGSRAAAGENRRPPAPRGRPKAAPAAPISVVVPVRDRPAARLRLALASLRWQERPPREVLVVSHGSRAEIDAELRALCGRFEAIFHAIGSPAEPWCKPRALNHGIQRTAADVEFVMTLDADMILAPNFLSVVAGRLEHGGPRGRLVLCRSCDLPQRLRLPEDPAAVLGRLAELRRAGRLRGRQACGGVQAARRSFFFEIRGYDEAFTWWGEEDRDLVARAERSGLEIVWIESECTMLHQWHPHATAVADPRLRRVIREALERNRALRRERAAVAVRDNPGWSA